MTAAERIKELEYKVGQAYQVIGYLLTTAGSNETPEGRRALEYFSRNHFHEDFDPWPVDDDFGVKASK